MQKAFEVVALAVKLPQDALHLPIKSFNGVGQEAERTISASLLIREGGFAVVNRIQKGRE
ncbi:hypothetical protein GWA01_07630 [Gluconobacter wancherniae NBRC 103581]|uniref:Uncharacterized protein n=1 Tax=Gluconobacter wancherniae NBRC 103581 TaxID=656744 RepID=A0A511B094_9PROT|nr:hypothetical protein AA103581_0694 [Gluconobacter wancherniae NBRC 103581]GEK92993.1 hypothetical protein GWA01_07630 [Gluconobacter wancherniae NBRC 103581]